MSDEINEIPEDLQVCQWKVEDKPRLVKDLIPNPKNPRRISRDQFALLKESIKTNGLIDNPCINHDGRIIAGHQRRRAIIQLGWKEVYCKVPPRPITEREFEVISLQHNKNMGEFDFEILANEWEIDVIFESGFTAEDLHLDLEEKEEKEKKEKECPHCGGKL
jgi:ParB-like chromosome segregation protein Spo0J